MFTPSNRPRPFLFAALGMVALLVVLEARALRRTSARVYATPQAEPWTGSQVEQPAELAKALADPKTKRPLVVYVGFDYLYRGAHIQGALFHGTGSKPDGLDQVKKWAQSIPRDQAIVVYCGCCPWSHCPNIRPAFRALHEMGFTNLKVLAIPTDLPTDWVQKGYGTEKGK
jgi:thiosulfate/3-mercaptopyruvate sulfurtransferase